MELVEKYTYTVYTLGGFSAAAKELYVSQPALSAAIARNEKALGFEIFDRSVSPIALTPAGSVYIEYLEQKEKNENIMKNRIRMLSEVNCGEIAIGAYSYSAIEVLSGVCGIFSGLYPNVKVRLDMGSIGKREILSEKMKNHALDMMLSYDFDQKECIGTPILTERMVIVMHKDMPGAKELIPLSVSRDAIINKQYSDKDLVSDLSVFKNVKFFDYSVFSNTRFMLNQILGEYKTANYIVENARQVDMHNELMKRGLGATLSTDFHITTKDFDDDNLIYLLPKSTYSQRILYIITLKHEKLSPAAEKFLEIAKKNYK